MLTVTVTHGKYNLAKLANFVIFVLLYPGKKLPFLRQYQLKKDDFFRVNTNIYKFWRLCKTTFPLFFTISPPNYTLLLILGCSF